jgi:hypothetical protein
MPLAKTEKARDALRRRDAGLRAGDRPLLIMCDGVRSDEALCALLGPDTAASLERLVAEGYLALTVAAAPVVVPPLAVAQRAAAETGPPSVFPPMAIQAPVSVPAPAPVAAPAPAAAAPAPPAARRSLAAAKVYTVGMLQLIRDAEAVEHVSAIQTCSEEAALVHHLFESLRYLGRKAPATYGRRVADRLLEILPETHLVALHAVADEVFELAEQAAQA